MKIPEEGHLVIDKNGERITATLKTSGRPPQRELCWFIEDTARRGESIHLYSPNPATREHCWAEVGLSNEPTAIVSYLSNGASKTIKPRLITVDPKVYN